MNTKLIARLAEEAGFEILTMGIDPTPPTDRIRGKRTREAVIKLCSLVAEECARQTERSSCADQAAARIRALFPLGAPGKRYDDDGNEIARPITAKIPADATTPDSLQRGWLFPPAP